MHSHRKERFKLTKIDNVSKSTESLIEEIFKTNHLIFKKYCYIKGLFADLGLLYNLVEI